MVGEESDIIKWGSDLNKIQIPGNRVPIYVSLGHLTGVQPSFAFLTRATSFQPDGCMLSPVKSVSVTANVFDPVKHTFSAVHRV